MEFILICSGLWNLIFAFAKWSLEAKERLLRVLGVLTGCTLSIIGICGFFFSINEKVMLTAFLMLLFVVGMSVNHRCFMEKNPLSKFAVASAIALTVIATTITVLAENVEDVIYSCATLTGSIMILSTPLAPFFEQIKQKKKA